jgi:hypothetical protein
MSRRQPAHGKQIAIGSVIAVPPQHLSALALSGTGCPLDQGPTNAESELSGGNRPKTKAAGKRLL